jgi:hypothetical protein
MAFDIYPHDCHFGQRILYLTLRGPACWRGSHGRFNNDVVSRAGNELHHPCNLFLAADEMLTTRS